METPESPTPQPITAHLLEMGFTNVHIKKAMQTLGKLARLWSLAAKFYQFTHGLPYGTQLVPPLDNVFMIADTAV